MTETSLKLSEGLLAPSALAIRESLKQPLVVIFEDLHRIDAETRLYPSQRFEC